MKNRSIDDGSADANATANILESAKFAYRLLAVTLQEAITGLNRDPGNLERAKECEVLVRAHYRSLQKVIELEVDLAKRSDAIIPTHIGSQLDLDAAREEICIRLVKLAERAGDGDVSELPEP